MQKSEKTLYNLGYLNGWLTNLARINDKTNHAYHFSLTMHESKNGFIKEKLYPIFDPICKSFELKKIETPREYLISLLTETWFFEFQEKEYNTVFLIDKQNNFSLSNSFWKQEWIKEFVDLLLLTVSSDIVYQVKIGETKIFYACSSLDIIFANSQELYHLHLSVSD
ncbi:hypothetical protein [Aquimarina sp. SS2-1]|uniref:hypothetical protein n=1 Tax=Aquimarina besae TaxID=3342247 RepID=UPI00366CCC4C